MKKFIMTSPYQPAPNPEKRIRGLEKGIYTAADNQLLVYDAPTSFPIIPTINGYAEEGEQIEAITIVSEYENAEYNYGLLKEELDNLSKKKGFSYTLKEVRVPYNNAIDTELELFAKLIDCTADGDTLYACITYGSKPFPLIQIMALNYAYRIRKNVSIGCIVYGAKDHNNGNMEIYDITSLLYIDEAVRLMAEQKVENPTELIKNLLK
jgi:hypothetical protein